MKTRIIYFFPALAPSTDLKESLATALKIRNEQIVEIFYNFSVTP